MTGNEFSSDGTLFEIYGEFDARRRHICREKLLVTLPRAQNAMVVDGRKYVRVPRH